MVIPPSKLKAPISGTLDQIYPVNVSHSVAINPPAKILPHKRNEIETNGATCEITSAGLMKIGTDFPF